MTDIQSAESVRWLAIHGSVRGNELPIIEALLCSTEHGILMTDLAGNDILCNPRFGELFGVDPDEIVTLSRDVVRRIALSRVRDRAEFVRRIEDIYGHPEVEYEDDIELANEPTRVLQRFTGPVRDTTGRVFGRVWTFKDVTELRALQSEVRRYGAQIEADARKQQEELAITSRVLRALTSISSAISTHRDEYGLITALTETCSGLLGQYSTGLLALDDTHCLRGAVCVGPGSQASPAVWRTETCVEVQRLFENSGAHSGPTYAAFQLENRSPLRKALGKSGACFAALRWAGQSIGLIAFGIERPEALLLPNRMPHVQAIATQITLALKIHQGRVQLQSAYKELEWSQEEALKAGKLTAVGALAASVAHDIRNILTPLRLEIAGSPEPKGLLAARTHVNRLSALTHRLLSVAMPGDFKPRPCNMRDIIDAAIEVVRAQASIDGIEIRAHFARKLPECLGEPARLENVFINLALNAISAMHLRGGTLKIDVRVEGNGIRVDVRDTGGGIPPEMHQRVFEPFFSTRPNGAGLGLYSVRRIVEEHQGWVRINSKRGPGASLSVWLPVAQADSPGKDVESFGITYSAGR